MLGSLGVGEESCGKGEREETDKENVDEKVGTHTYSLSLSHTNTHTNTHTPSVFVCGQNLLASLAGIAEDTLYYPLGKNEGFLPHVDLADIGKVRLQAAIDFG